MKLVWVLGFWLVLVAAPAPAGQPEGPLARVRAQALSAGLPAQEVAAIESACGEGGFASAETARVLRLVARARVGGLPHRDLLSKLREGVAKGAPPEAVLRVLERRSVTLRQARDLVERLILEGRRPADEAFALSVVADALWAGAGPAEVLRSVREGRPLSEGLPDVLAAFRAP